jgi:hypothetical protein
MITIKDLKDELQSQCVIIDRKFEMYDTKLDGFKTEVGRHFEKIETNELVHLKADINDLTNKVDIFANNQKWAFLIGGTIITLFMGANAYLLKHLFTLLT